MTIPSLPPMPARPAVLDRLIRTNNAAVLAYREAFAAYASESQQRELAAAMIAARKAVSNWWSTTDGAAYRIACEQYNAALDARQVYRINERQARANAAAAAGVRNAACPRCFASHPGEC